MRILISLFFTLSSVMFISPVYAQSACRRTFDCPDGGVMVCDSQIDENGVCNTTLPGASCSACAQPQPESPTTPETPSSPSTPESPPSSSNPQSPSQNPPESSPSSNKLSPDEAALYRLTKSTLPETVESSIKPKEKTLFDAISDLFSKFISVFGFQPGQPGFFASRAETQHQAELPGELKPSGNVLEQTHQNIGGNSGIDSVDLPAQVKTGAVKTQDFEKLNEKASYPPGIHPITKQ